MKAVILLSGGLDSATALAMAMDEGKECYALSFDYGQRHLVELECARRIAQSAVIDHMVITLDLRAFGGSALTDNDIDVPVNRTASEMGKDIPVTYVPARNIIFLSYALAYAQSIEAETIWIGVNALDYSGYPDCRPEFIVAFQKMAWIGLGGDEHAIRVPLIDMTKKEIILKGVSLGVDYGLTVSCYQPTGIEAKDSIPVVPCGECDSCLLREKGFFEAGVADPALA